MGVKITDKNSSPYSLLIAGQRKNLFNAVAAAHDSLADGHAAHGHLRTITKVLGGEYDSDGTDGTQRQIDATSPGERSRVVPSREGSAPQATGASAPPTPRR
jgi:hypothetical protein